MKKQENVKMGDILQSNNGDSWVVVNVGVDVILIQNIDNRIYSRNYTR